MYEVEAEGGCGVGWRKTVAPILLRVSMLRWERVDPYTAYTPGILLPIYTYHMLWEKERDPEHRTLCDLGSWVKCSAASR